MNETQWWKNFDLNTELHTAGGFLYDGLQQLNHCEHFEHDDELFQVLYALSIGFERLMKVAIVLGEHTPKTDQEKFEERLKTHDTRVLLHRISTRHSLNLAKPHHALVHCLSEFYKVYRYDRYRLATVRERHRLRESFRAFLATGEILLSDAGKLFVTDDMGRIRRYMGKITGKLCTEIYDLITALASKAGTFTYEIRSQSKASKIFQAQQFTFTAEETALRELLIFLLRHHRKTKLSIVLDAVKPLPFDRSEAIDHLAAFLRPVKRMDLAETVAALREEVPNAYQRDDPLNLIGDGLNHVYTDDEIRAMGGEIR